MTIGAITKNPAPNPLQSLEPMAGAGEVNISEAIKKSGSIPTGYKGADGKVKVDRSNGAIVTTGKIEGNDAGFFVAFRPVTVGNNKKMSLYIKGEIIQKQGWDHYASIQVMDEDGERYIIQEVCREGKYGSCSGKDRIKPSAVRQGTTLSIKLPEGLKNIARVEVVFVGETSVETGFNLSNIKLTK